MTFQISSAILGLSSEGPGHFSSLAHLFLCVVRALKAHPVRAEGQDGWGQAFCGDLLKHLPGPGPELPFLGRSGALHQGGPPPHQPSMAAMATQPPCTGLTHQLAGMLNGRGLFPWLRIGGWAVLGAQEGWASCRPGRAKREMCYPHGLPSSGWGWGHARR